MANKKNKEEEVIDPVNESRELEKEQAEVFAAASELVVPEPDKTYIILTRENLTLIAPNVWRYKHDASISDCKIPSAFHGEMARNFGLRPLDLVFCQTDKEAIMVVVPE